MNLPSRYNPTGRFFGGGQGVVSIWHDNSLDRDVAVKVLSASGIGGSLAHEASLLGAIKSKHVVELYEVGQDSSTGQDYFIMECVTGGPELHGYSPPSIRDLLLTLYQIACGLNDIHSVDCIHRDLKPTNMKRDGQNVIKIIDFGLGASSTPANTVLGRGTTGYRGPEYYSSPIALSSAADIYAFGAIAYEFSFGNLDPSLLSHPPVRPPSFQTALIGMPGVRIPQEICEILDQCLNSVPSDRPCASELKTLLCKHLIRDLHVASFVHGANIYNMSKASSSYRITAAQGTFEIRYDGLDFILRNINAPVYINGIQASNGTILPASCVITVGSGSGSDRAFIPFNVSHPEVVL